MPAVGIPENPAEKERKGARMAARWLWMYEQLENADLYIAPAGKHGHHTDQIKAFGPVLLRFLNRIHGPAKGD
jgi:hypothetical protein